MVFYSIIINFNSIINRKIFLILFILLLIRFACVLFDLRKNEKYSSLIFILLVLFFFERQLSSLNSVSMINFLFCSVLISLF